MVWRENMKNEHEIKRLDSTKVIFILKGILIGAIAGIIVSLFRLLIEEMMNHLVALLFVVPYQSNRVDSLDSCNDYIRRCRRILDKIRTKY